MATTHAFGRTIRELRVNQGLTQEALANRSPALTQAFISMVEQGHYPRPSPEKIRALADALRADYTDLMVAAGYIAGDDLDRPSLPYNRIDADLLAYADERPDLRAALDQLRDENTEEDYRRALRIVHRAIFAGIESARETFARREEQ